MFLNIRNIISNNRRSNVADFAALIHTMDFIKLLGIFNWSDEGVDKVIWVHLCTGLDQQKIEHKIVNIFLPISLNMF